MISKLTDCEQLEKSLYEILAQDPTPRLESTLQQKVLEHIEKLGFSQKKFERYRENFAYLAKHPEEVAVLGAIERAISIKYKELQHVRSAEKVIDLAARSTRIFLSIQSYAKNKEPFAFCFARYDKQVDQEYRFFTDYEGDIIAGSSLTHTRSRAATKPLPPKHPLSIAIKDAAVSLFSRQTVNQTDANPKMPNTIADFVIPGKRAVNYISTLIPRDSAILVRDYAPIRLNVVVDMAISVNIFGMKAFYSRIIETNPGFMESDKVQITDGNGFTWAEIQAHIAKNEARAPGTPKEIMMRINEYSLGAVYAASKEMQKTSSPLIIEECEELIETGAITAKSAQKHEANKAKREADAKAAESQMVVAAPQDASAVAAATQAGYDAAPNQTD